MNTLLAVLVSAICSPQTQSSQTDMPIVKVFLLAGQSNMEGHGHHWFGNAESYLRIGDSMGQAIVKLDRDAQNSEE